MMWWYMVLLRMTSVRIRCCLLSRSSLGPSGVRWAYEIPMWSLLSLFVFLQENLMNSVNCKSFNQKSVKLGILKLQNCNNFKKIIPKINIIRSEYEFRKSSALDVFALSPRNNIRQQVSQKSPKGTFVRELNFETSSAQELSSLCHSEIIELTNQVNPVGDEESEFLLEIFNSKCSLKKHSLGEQQYASLYQECWHSEPHARPTIKYLVNTINQMILSGFQDL